LCGAQANWQANLSPNHLSLGVKKAKEKLANAKTREQVARVQAQTLLEMAQTTCTKV